MTTYVDITNLDEVSFEKLISIVKDSESTTLDSEQAVKPLFENYDLDRSWMEENVGSKWINVEFIDGDAKSGDAKLIIESAWSVPSGYLEKLSETLCSVKSDVVINGTYEDESYEPCGAFIYAEGYEDINDYDEEIDSDKMWEDDDYRDKVYVELNELKKELLNSYLEYLQD